MRLTVSNKYLETSDAHDRNLLVPTCHVVNQEGKTDHRRHKQMILGPKHDDNRFSGCNMFTTDSLAVTHDDRLLGREVTGKRWDCHVEWLGGMISSLYQSCSEKLERCVFGGNGGGFVQILSLRLTSQPCCLSSIKN